MFTIYLITFVLNGGVCFYATRILYIFNLEYGIISTFVYYVKYLQSYE